MPKQILFVNACVRPGSRTLRIARHILSLLDGDVSEICLEKEISAGNIAPLDNSFIEYRQKCSLSGRFEDKRFSCAKMFAEADAIAIAAPYWDLSFPSSLKIFFENVCVDGLTFRYTEQGMPIGLCRAKDIIYVSSAGGNLCGDYGYGYAKNLCSVLLGIKNFHLLQAEGLDLQGNSPEKIISEACRRAGEIARLLTQGK